MRKLLYGAIVLITIAAFLSLTQMSCQRSEAQLENDQNTGGETILYNLNSIVEQPTGRLDSLGKPIVTKMPVVEYYVSNIDGSGLKKIPINLPASLQVLAGGKLTPDGKQLVFNVTSNVYSTATNPANNYVYSCSINGSNLRRLFEGSQKVADIR